MLKLYPNAFRNASLTLITLFSCITFALAAPKGSSFGQAPSTGLTGFDGGTGTSSAFGTNQPSPFTALNVLSSGFDVTAIGAGTNVTLTATGGSGYGTASPAGADNRYIRGQRASAAGSFSELDFASDDGSAFNLQSIAVSATLLTSTDQVKVVLTGYRSGTQVGSPVSVTVAASNAGVVWALVTTNFGGIDEVKVVFSDNDNPSGAVGAGGVDALTLGGFSVINPALSNGQAGVAYTAENFTGSGGASPYTFAVVSGSLPSGMSLSSAGTLSGTPKAVGTFNFSVQATDATAQTSAADPVSLTITAPSLGLTPTSLSDGSYKGAYSAVTFAGSGGVAPYIYSAVGLPPGMSINATTGVLSGTPTSAGTYSIAVTVQDATTGAGSPYSKTNFITLVIDKVPLTVTANNATKLYGAANPSFSAAYTGFVGGDNTGSLTAQATFTTTATAASPVGNYPITASNVVDPNYSITYVGGTLAVQPASLTITADHQSMPYGGPLPTFTASYSGFVNGDNVSSLSTLPAFSTTASLTSPPGTYSITPMGAADANYTITYNTGTLTVGKATLTITANNATMTYGSAAPTLLGVSYSGFIGSDNSSVLTAQPSVTTTAGPASNVGNYPITASGATAANYNITYVAGTMTVGPATVTVTPNNINKAYGAPVPALSVAYSGFLNGQTASVLTTIPTVTTTAGSTSPVGNYTITASGAVAPNYTFSYIPGTLTVGAAVLTVTANNATMVYGGSLPSLSVSYSGFVNGDDQNSLTSAASLSVAATPAAPVGTYSITPSGIVDPNYTFNYVPGTLTITPAALTIQAAPATMVYGSNVPALSATYSGFTNGDNAASLTTVPTITTTANSGSSVGTYPITAANAVDPNYDITYLPGVMTVTKAALTVTADDQTMPPGGPLPALTVHYTGFVNGDNAASLTTAPTATTTATAGSPAGTYPITPTGGSVANYTLSYVDGTLTVQKATLTITALPANSVYGSPLVPNGSLQVSYSGFVNGDNAASLTVPPVVINTSFTGAPAGTYQLIPSGAVDPNYTIVYVNGTYTISPATLNVTANAQTKAYGTPDPTLTYTVSGFVNGDNSSIFSGGLTRTQGETVGSYPIMEGTLSAGNNYVVTFTGNTLTITKAPQTITWTQSLVSGCNGINQILLTASVTSGLPITYTSSNTNVATVSGDTLTLVAPGTSVITANQPGDANYLAATAVTATVTDQTPALVSQHWNDVLFFDNSGDNYVQWQWYKDGAAIPGATRSYYSETPSLNGQYYVIATDNNGQQIQSCPLTVTPGTTIPGGIKVFPNPVLNGVAVNVVCNYTPAALQGARMQILDLTGKVKQVITNVQPSMQVTMPSGSGIYIINLLLANGQKASINVLVAE